MSSGKLTKFSRKLKYMKFRKYEKKSKDIKINEETQLEERKLGKKCVEKEFETDYFKCGAKRHIAINCPSKKRVRRPISNMEKSSQSNENESNRSDECINSSPPLW